MQSQTMPCIIKSSETCALLGYSLPMFWDNFQAPFSNIKKIQKREHNTTDVN
jgi:hypothetical protein